MDCKQQQAKHKDIYHIGIDGPSASGKGTVAKRLSQHLNIPCLDTGAMYRGVAVYVLDNKIDPKDETAVTTALESMNMRTDIAPTGETKIFLNDKDITNRLRENNISVITSPLSQFASVRDKLVAMQQDIAKTQSFILEGRDIGTVVLSHAKYKFFLTASAKVRAKRRFEELASQTKDSTAPSFKEILKQVKQRDKNDRTRKIGPLKKAKGAIKIDASHLTIDETVDRILKFVMQ